MAGVQLIAQGTLGNADQREEAIQQLTKGRIGGPLQVDESARLRAFRTTRTTGCDRCESEVRNLPVARLMAKQELRSAGQRGEQPRGLERTRHSIYLVTRHERFAALQGASGRCSPRDKGSNIRLRIPPAPVERSTRWMRLTTIQV